MSLKHCGVVAVFFLALVPHQSWSEDKPSSNVQNPFSVSLPALAQENTSPDVQIFLNGKLYKSFDEYKKAVAENNVTEALDSSNIPPTQDISDENFLIQGTSSDGHGQAPAAYPGSIEPKDLSAENESSAFSAKDTGKEEDIAQMQDMLAKYLADHKESGSVTIDPQKVKTIVISPSTSSNPEEK